MTEKILLIQLRQLGDILLTTPCIREIKRERPDSHITFLSARMGRFILENNPFIDEYFFYDDRPGWREEWRLAQTLRRRKFDLVIDFMNNPRSALYSWMSQGQQRIAFASSRRFAYSDCIPKSLRGKGYIVDEKFELLRAAGFSPRQRGLTLPWFEPHTRPLLQLLGASPEFAQAPLRVVLSPTHRREHRRWPLAHYAELAQWLVKEREAQVVWIWGPGEEELIDSCQALCQVPTLKAPATTFREMAALIANCDLFIGNSNGPSHVAVAVDIPSLQLHGHTMGTSWCPDSRRHRYIQSPAVDGDLQQLKLTAVIDALTAMDPILKTQAVARSGGKLRTSWSK